jgi:8-oxo-dGTP pyrophosphatase MutT (NUDIX family)
VADIYKVGALWIRRKKLLIVHKKTIDRYITLGGKKEKGETDLETLAREVREEARRRVLRPRHYRTFESKTHDGKEIINQACYLCSLDGEPRVNPDDKIDGFLWVGRNYKKLNLNLAPQLEDHILPALIKDGYL